MLTEILLASYNIYDRIPIYKTEIITIRAFARANFILEFQWLYNKFESTH